MIYVYIFPKNEFDRNIADNDLIKAFLNRNGVVKQTLDEFINNLNDDFINLDTHWVRIIDDEKDYYSISRLHKDDLEHLGFNVRKVTESNLLTIASKLGDDYCDSLFWNSLDIIATGIGIPKRKNNKKGY